MVLPKGNSWATVFFWKLTLIRQRQRFGATKHRRGVSKTWLIRGRKPAAFNIACSMVSTRSPLRHFFHCTILTVGARGDHRDNLFNPHKGYFLIFRWTALFHPVHQHLCGFCHLRWF